MARDSSPFSQRLKALAVRAGLPVDSGPAAAPPAPTPEDEQPTGEFAAVPAADAPDDDQPTGEFPPVTESVATDPVDEPAATPEPAAVEPSPPVDESAPEPTPVAAADDAPTTSFEAARPIGTPQDASSPVPPPVRDSDDGAPPPPAPIWTDAPPESQTPAGPTQTDGPTLAPPTLSKPEALHEALSLPADDEPAATAEAPAGEPEPATPELSDKDEATIAAEPATTAFSPVSVVADEPPAASTPDEVATDEPTPASTDAQSEPATEVVAPAGDDADAPESAASLRERLSLTGRFPALRRKKPPADAPADAAPTAVATAPEPAPIPAPPTPAPVPEYDDVLGKPSFSERAALRRRVKTLRARRDVGLLELGAIVLDQRRFGDPTAGALLRRRTDELGDLDNEVAEIEHALGEHASTEAVAALGTIRCLGCASLVGPADRFCAHCGTPRPPAEAATPADRAL